MMTTAIEGQGRGQAYGIGWAVAVVTALLLVWTTIVRDEGNAAGFFLTIMGVGVGGFAARFTPDGMARTMLGVAAMQAVFGMLIATAPVTATTEQGVLGAVIYNAIFTVLWLGSAACFRAAASRLN